MNPTRNRKSGLGNPPPTAGALGFYPNLVASYGIEVPPFASVLATRQPEEESGVPSVKG